MNKLTIPALAAAFLVLGAAPSLFADAKDNWIHNCTFCHGPEGAGHTKAGRMKGVKDLTDPKSQAGFTDEQAAARIKDGLKDADTGKEKMKAFGDKFSAAEIKELVDYVRTFHK